MDKKTYYAVMKLNLWSRQKFYIDGLIHAKDISLQSPENGEIGYISVFDTRDNAIRWNDGKDENIIMVQDV